MQGETSNRLTGIGHSRNSHEQAETSGNSRSVLYNELKRRKVIRAAAAYIVTAWVAAQVADVLCGAFEAPEWAMQAVIIALAIGFPIVVIVSWFFEVTTKIAWEKEIEPVEEFAYQKGRTLDFSIIVFLTLVIGILLANEASVGCFNDSFDDGRLAGAEYAVQKRAT